MCNINKLIVLTMAFLSFSIGYSRQVQADNRTLPGCDGLKNTFLGKGGWIFEDWELQNEFTFSDIKSYKSLQDALESRGIYLIALPIPSRPYAYIDTVDPQKYPNLKFSKVIYRNNWNGMINVAEKNGINVINILPAIDKFKPSTRNEAFFYTGDHHWTTSGAQVAAEVAAKYIEKLIISKKLSLKKSDKQISESVGNEYSGSFNYHYMTSCNSKLENLKTYKVSVKSSNEGLVDDESASIGVFGDSFGLTNPDNNFAPYLEYYTKLKVVNYSAEGGGFFGAMLGYFADKNVNSNLPKIIVVPAQGVLQNNPFLYSEAVATLNLCKNPVLDSNRRSQLSTPNVWNRLDYSISDIVNAKTLHLKFDNQLAKFKIKFTMSDNKDEIVETDRYFPEDYRGSRTDFYIPIMDAKNTIAISFMNEDMNTPSKSVTLDLCKF